MRTALTGILAFSVLTLWIPAHWPLAVFQFCVFALACLVLTIAPPDRSFRPLPVLAITFACLWGIVQLWSGRTVYAFETKNAILYWATLLAIMLIGVSLFRSEADSHRFRMALLWFVLCLAVEAILQKALFPHRIFGLFDAGNVEGVMASVLNRNQFAAIVEAVLPIALYEAISRREGRLAYIGVSAVLFASVVASSSRAGTILVSAEIIGVPALLLGRGLVRRADALRSLSLFALMLVTLTAIVGWAQITNRFRESNPLEIRLHLLVPPFR